MAQDMLAIIWRLNNVKLVSAAHSLQAGMLYLKCQKDVYTQIKIAVRVTGCVRRYWTACLWGFIEKRCSVMSVGDRYTQILFPSHNNSHYAKGQSGLWTYPTLRTFSLRNYNLFPLVFGSTSTFFLPSWFPLIPLLLHIHYECNKGKAFVDDMWLRANVQVEWHKRGVVKVL